MFCAPLGRLASRAGLSLAMVLGVCALGGPLASPAAADTIGAGSGHICAVKVDGTVSCWGSATNGQLGNGFIGPYSSGTPTQSPVPVAAVGINNAIAVAAGTSHTCALRAGGSVNCWGAGSSGELGNGAAADSAVPVPVTGMTDAAAISAGSASTCALRTGGTVSCWGARFSPAPGHTASMVPVAVAGISGATAISAGDRHTCVIRPGGTISCWGEGKAGELGNGASADSAVPVTVTGITDAIAITARSGHTCALRAGGSVSCWGEGYSGVLGNGGTANAAVPATVAGITDAIAVSTSYRHSCAVRASGSIRCWGNNEAGQLGNGRFETSATSVDVASMSDAVAVAVGSNFTCSLRAAGTINCWGNNFSGQLGDGSEGNLGKAAPDSIVSLPGVRKPPAIPAVAAPLNVTPPSIRGTASLRSTVTCDEGSWQNFPATFSYQWLADDVAISGATGASFAITTAVAGRALSCRVTAGNAIGSALAISARSTICCDLGAPGADQKAGGDSGPGAGGQNGGRTPGAALPALPVVTLRATVKRSDFGKGVAFSIVGAKPKSKVVAVVMVGKRRLARIAATTNASGAAKPKLKLSVAGRRRLKGQTQVTVKVAVTAPDNTTKTIVKAVKLK